MSVLRVLGRRVMYVAVCLYVVVVVDAAAGVGSLHGRTWLHVVERLMLSMFTWKK